MNIVLALDNEFVKEKMPNILYVAPEKILCLTDN